MNSIPNPNKRVKSITFRISHKAHNKMIYNKMKHQSMTSIINECLENYHDLDKKFNQLIEEWESMPKGD